MKKQRLDITDPSDALRIIISYVPRENLTLALRAAKVIREVLLRLEKPNQEAELQAKLDEVLAEKHALEQQVLSLQDKPKTRKPKTDSSTVTS